MAGATARLEVRVRPESKTRIERAASIAHQPVSDFVRSAAEERADEVLRVYETETRVPSEFFDELLAALDIAACPNEALAKAAVKARSVVVRD